MYIIKSWTLVATRNPYSEKMQKFSLWANIFGSPPMEIIWKGEKSKSTSKPSKQFLLFNISLFMLSNEYLASEITFLSKGIAKSTTLVFRSYVKYRFALWPATKFANLWNFPNEFLKMIVYEKFDLGWHAKPLFGKEKKVRCMSQFVTFVCCQRWSRSIDNSCRSHVCSGKHANI